MMLTARNVVTSAVQNSTQTNRENESSKSYEEKLKERISELETQVHVLQNDNRRLRTEVIEHRMKVIKEYRESKEAFMQIAV